MEEDDEEDVTEDEDREELLDRESELDDPVSDCLCSLASRYLML